MSLPLIIAIKQWHDSDMEFVSQETSKNMAESKAEMLYIEMLLHSVEVFEIDKQAIFKEDKVVSIFLIKRTCIHPHLQRQFLYERSSSNVICDECHLKFRKEVFINKDEQTEEALVEYSR